VGARDGERDDAAARAPRPVVQCRSIVST
jgi:hypothetical protein